MLFRTSLVQVYSLALLFNFAAADPYQDSGDGDSQLKVLPLRTHELKLPFVDQDSQSRWWDFGGDTVINVNNHVRLTYDRPSQSGWLFSRMPLSATNVEIVTEFKIHGAGSGVSGDGIAFWITKERGIQGPVFGFQDNWNGLGIVIDTYKNNRPGVTFPYVMGMFNDGTQEYDHDHDGKANDLGGCSAKGLRGSSIPTKMKVYLYDKNIDVSLQYKAPDEWTPCFTMFNITMPSIGYLGFSAHTGQLSDHHDIISVKTSHIHRPTGNGPSRGSTFGSRQRKSGGSRSGGGFMSWLWFFLKFLLFGAAVVGAYVGYAYYRQKNDRERFNF